MPKDESFSQSASGMTLNFVFRSDSLRYRITAWDGSREFDVPYENVDPTILSSFTFPNHPYTSQIYARVIIAIALALIVSYNTDAFRFISILSAIVFIVTASICESGRFAITLTMLTPTPPPPGSANLPVQIMEGKAHDLILSTFGSRWRQHLKTHYGEVDHENDPKVEARRLAWLHEKNIISEEELAELSDQLQSPLLLESKPPTLN